MKKIKSNSGMTLTELLAATLIMLLVSMGLATGVALSNKEFIYSIRQSEAQELYGTISSLLTNELRYTNEVSYKDSLGTVDTFYSVTYALQDKKTSLVSLDSDDKETSSYGYLALGSGGTYNKILGPSSYPNNLGAKATIVYDDDNKVFTVTLDIGVIDGSSIISRTFNVRAINNINVGS